MHTAATFRRLAAAECDRCRGRHFGDCDPACRFWAATAGPHARHSGGHHQPRQPRPWLGPVRHGLDLTELEIVA